MKIAILGAGNVGGALAKQWAKSGHEISLGARDTNSEKIKKLESFNGNIKAYDMKEAVEKSEVILISLSIPAVVQVAKSLSDLSSKIIIDATNSVFGKPEPYKNTFEAFKEITGCNDIIKCFNTTGFENMENPVYKGKGIDMFVAGKSGKAKEVAIQLSKDAGFESCYDFGGDDKVELIEQFAMAWINLAIIQGQGRDIAFKVLKR